VRENTNAAHALSSTVRRSGSNAVVVVVGSVLFGSVRFQQVEKCRLRVTRRSLRATLCVKIDIDIDVDVHEIEVPFPVIKERRRFAS
jgi:hypothetical protein